MLPPPRAVSLLVLLPVLAATAPTEPAAPSAQLAAILGPAVEEAVGRAVDDWQQAALDSRLGRLEESVQAVRLQLTALAAWQPAPAAVCPAPATICPTPTPTPTPEPTPEPTPTCEERPSPVVAEPPLVAPAVRACAHSCLQLRDRIDPLPDGVYWLRGLPVPAFCDFSHDGGGWTLLLTAVSKEGWDALSVFGRSERSPSLIDNYSILRHADAIRDLGTGGRFAYRIETHAQEGRRRWGGVWLAPRRYSFTHETPAQTEVSLVRRFDNWAYVNEGVKKRMPWVNTGARGDGHEAAILTTAGVTGNWWGTMVTSSVDKTFQHSPWMYPIASKSGTVLYWMREEMF